MILSPQQAKAGDAVGAWLNDPNSKQVFRLFGYAGTGKTTLAKYLASLQKGKSVFATFTGKAASVLQRKGVNATTIHSLIYEVDRGDDEDQAAQSEAIKELRRRISESTPAVAVVLRAELQELLKPCFTLKEDALKGIDLVVIDEVSMVGADIGQDLLSFGKKILVLGDPAQLPPVDGGGFFTNDAPDVLLTEIHRQAQDSPIIRMASQVRQGFRLKKGRYGTSECIDRRETNLDPRGFDQLIVGTNNTRREWNTRYRDLFGWLSSSPEQGEKIICLRNDREVGLLNGTQWRVINAEDKGYAIAATIWPWDNEMEPDDEGLLLDMHPFDTDFKQLQWWERKRAQEFDFGYAITCHKAQGSQWKNVYVQDQSFIFKKEANRWLYTALTRAEETVVVAL